MPETPSPSDGLVVCADGQTRPEAECFRDPNGNWHSNDHVCCCYDSTYWHEEDCVELASGEFAHENDPAIVVCADDERRHVDDCEVVDDEYHPRHRCVECSSCSEYILRVDSFGHSGEYYCEECYSDNFRDCDECGGTYPADDVEEGCCERCRESSSGVQRYSSRAANRLRSEHLGRELVGVELEVEPASGFNRTTAVAAVRKHLSPKYCVLKEDGSLGPGGFEIVTRPDSIDVHVREFKKLLDSTERKFLRSWSTGRCGMHVHVNRKWLTQLQLGKMLVFLNHDKNRRFVSGIAGRSCDTWAKMKSKKITDVRRYDERYVALNIGPNTAEFRIFRGTVAIDGFVKNLEFVRALVEFTAPAARSIADSVDHTKFVRWVSPKAYPTLYDYLAERGLRPPRKTGGKGNGKPD